MNARPSSPAPGSTWAGWNSSPETGATSPRSSTPPAPRWWWSAVPTGRSTPSTTSAATGATSWCGRTIPARRRHGTCRQFTCKYHGWRYSTEGQLTFIQQESEFFDLDRSDYGLADVQVETWEGFIFVNLDGENSTSLKEYLGDLGAGLAGYPFDKMTQVYKYRADVGSNWKLFIDAFAEFYHAPILHAKQATADESRKLSGYGFEALAYKLDGPHGMVSSWGGMSPPKDPAMVKPIERVVQSGLFGPWERPDIEGLDDLPPALNPAGHRAWGVDSFVFFPNFMLLIWQPGWYLTYHYWPTSYNTHIFEGTLYFVPPTSARERLRQELAAVTFKEYSLQDGNTLEATQTMLESRAVSHFPLNDQEILLRQLHKTAGDYVADYEQKRATRCASPGPEHTYRPAMFPESRAESHGCA